MNKLIAIHQPNYLPWMGYFYKINVCDTFVILDNVQYEKNGFTNRNQIKTSQGPKWLTVGVLTKNRLEQKIQDVRINNQVHWTDTHWKSILQNYSKASFFSAYKEEIQYIYLNREWEYLSDLNISLLTACCKILDIDTEKFVKASELNVSGSGTDLLIDICNKLGGDAYLSGSGGRNYQDESQFQEAAIQLKYNEFKHPRYTQLWGEFVPNMSILDLLFNEGPNSRDILRNQS